MPGRTPIAVLSGADTERLAAALRAGADWAFAKPVEWDDLLRCLTCRAAGEIAGTAAADEAVPMTVLVVEDGQAMRGLLRETLERAGHRVIERADGADLPGLVTRKRCDVVVLDEQLPGVRGLELPRCPADDPAVGPRDSRDGVRRCRHGGGSPPPGARGYLEKPFRMAEMLDALAALAPSTAVKPRGSRPDRS